MSVERMPTTARRCKLGYGAERHKTFVRRISRRAHAAAAHRTIGARAANWFAAEVGDIAAQGVPVHALGSRFLTIGCHGEDVRELQRLLAQAGIYNHAEGPTGYYGSYTRACVEQWQRAQGIPVTGEFGETCRTSYLTTLKQRGLSVGVAPQPHGADSAAGIERLPVLLAILIAVGGVLLLAWRKLRSLISPAAMRSRQRTHESASSPTHATSAAKPPTTRGESHAAAASTQSVGTHVSVDYPFDPRDKLKFNWPTPQTPMHRNEVANAASTPAWPTARTPGYGGQAFDVQPDGWRANPRPVQPRPPAPRPSPVVQPSAKAATPPPVRRASASSQPTRRHSSAARAVTPPARHAALKQAPPLTTVPLTPAPSTADAAAAALGEVSVHEAFGASVSELGGAELYPPVYESADAPQPARPAHEAAPVPPPRSSSTPQAPAPHAPPQLADGSDSQEALQTTVRSRRMTTNLTTNPAIDGTAQRLPAGDRADDGSPASRALPSRESPDRPTSHGPSTQIEPNPRTEANAPATFVTPAQHVVAVDAAPAGQPRGPRSWSFDSHRRPAGRPAAGLAHQVIDVLPERPADEPRPAHPPRAPAAAEARRRPAARQLPSLEEVVVMPSTAVTAAEVPSLGGGEAHPPPVDPSPAVDALADAGGPAEDAAQASATAPPKPRARRLAHGLYGKADQPASGGGNVKPRGDALTVAEMRQRMAMEEAD